MNIEQRKQIAQQIKGQLNPLVWIEDDSPNTKDVYHCQACGIHYTISNTSEGLTVYWHNQSENSHQHKGGFDSINDAKAWVADEHYPMQMAWWVKPISWTSIKDSVPKSNGEYLVCVADSDDLTIRDREIDIDAFDIKTGLWFDYAVDVTSYQVSHWMPLPKLPEE